jgi:hypothetical protein
MKSEMSETAIEFAETACKLLSEYTNRLAAQKQEVVTILDRFHESSTIHYDLKSYLRSRYRNEMDEFLHSRQTFEVLIRKVSQWVEHGTSPKPGLELELELRLADFERMLRSMDDFFQSNSI